MSRPYLSKKELQHLTPGVLDDAAAEFFANGHCASMALALHHLTGWPIYGFSPKGGLAQHYTHHAVVKSPFGFLDAKGLHALEAWRHARGFEHDDYRIVQLNQCDLHYAWRNLRLVYPFAEDLLDRYFRKIPIKAVHP